MATKPTLRSIPGGGPKGTSQEQPPEPTVGSLIRHHRNALHWSQKTLAERVGVQPAYICEIETDAKTPSDRLCISIADAFGTDAMAYVELARKKRAEKAPAEIRQLLSEVKATKVRYDREMEQFLDDFKNLDPEGQACVRRLVGKMRSYVSARRET